MIPIRPSTRWEDHLWPTTTVRFNYSILTLANCSRFSAGGPSSRSERGLNFDALSYSFVVAYRAWNIRITCKSPEMLFSTTTPAPVVSADSAGKLSNHYNRVRFGNTFYVSTSSTSVVVIGLGVTRGIIFFPSFSSNFCRSSNDGVFWGRGGNDFCHVRKTRSVFFLCILCIILDRP